MDNHEQHMRVTLPETQNWMPIRRLALQAEVVAQIEKMIDDGVLLPGTRIPERQLCAQLGVSRTPLREAFQVLATKRLIELQPRRGAVVKRIEPEEIQDMFQVLEALEGLAGELACEAISELEFDEIESLHRKMMMAYRRRAAGKFFDINRQIHEAIVKAANNPILAHIYEGLSGQVKRLRYLSDITPDQWEVAIREHEEIIAALKARNSQALSRALRQHLTTKRERVKALIAR